MKKIEEMELFEAFFLIAIKKVYQKNNYDVPYVHKENDIYNRINDFYSLKFGKRLDITIETEKTKLWLLF